MVTTWASYGARPEAQRNGSSSRSLLRAARSNHGRASRIHELLCQADGRAGGERGNGPIGSIRPPRAGHPSGARSTRRCRSPLSPTDEAAVTASSKQKSARTRRAYWLDVRHFMRMIGITTVDELRQADHKAVIAWERYMRETEHTAASTIRRRLAALSSLFKHLVRHGHAARNPVGEVERPAINRDEGATLAFSKAQAREIFDAPRDDAIADLRDRAILSVGLRVGLRRAEIAALKVGDLHQNRGDDSLRVVRKGGRRDALAINPQTAARIRAYLEAAGHGGDAEGAMFRPLRHNGKQDTGRRHMDPDAIDRVVRKYASQLGLDRGYSAHSMRATFITTALENGAQLEDVQKAAGHRDPSTTKLYDRRGYNPEKAASFFATYCRSTSCLLRRKLRSRRKIQGKRR
jgi:integrase/recombinase XerD